MSGDEVVSHKFTVVDQSSMTAVPGARLAASASQRHQLQYSRTATELLMTAREPGVTMCPPDTKETQ
jgi:hypothetical protein